MKKEFKSGVGYFFLLLLLGLFGCNKDLSTKGPNSAPVANAGEDQSILLPWDNVILDGTASQDPDGFISSYSWKEIAGPESHCFTDSSSVLTDVKNLKEGVYEFELTVVDNMDGLSKDVVEIIVSR